MWRGTRILGDEIMLGCSCDPGNGVPTAPDSAPTMRIYDSTGTLVVGKTIPPLDKFSSTGLFSYMQPLNSSFATGRYVVRYSYVISGTTYTPEFDVFEIVAGGNAAGQGISMFYLDRPDQNDFILAQTDSGSLTISRGPRI